MTPTKDETAGGHGGDGEGLPRWDERPERGLLGAASGHEKSSVAPQLTENMLVDPQDNDRIVKKARDGRGREAIREIPG